MVDSVCSDTLHADHDELEQILPVLRKSTYGIPKLSAQQVVIHTQNSKLEFKADGDSIEITELD
jgi:hypothetical protein